MGAAELDGELRLLLDAIFRQYNYDFRDYSAASLQRRLQQAMRQLACPDLACLSLRLRQDPALFTQLLQFLTVSVSEMFRDPSYFLLLRQEVMPFLRTYPSLKLWVAGCSTGEEAYSLAILLHEEGLLERSIIYATDINPCSLQKAQRGVFARDAMAIYSDNYLRAGGKASLTDYFILEHGGARFDRSLCRGLTFADHSLATDMVFAETQLVSCRNVLIYFNKTLQNRALGLFHESLGQRGFLGLGNKESLEFSAYAKHFASLSRGERIYRRL